MPRQTEVLKAGQDKAECVFAFTNSSTKPVKIVSVVPDCSCILSPMKEAQFAPGESGRIPVTFVVGSRCGKVKKTLQVFTDASPKPDLLELVFDIPVLVEVSPRILVWKKGEANDARKIRISMKEEPYQILGVQSVNRAFQTELKTRKTGREFEIVVQPTDTKMPRSSELIIQTDSPYASWNHIVCQMRVE